MNRVSTFGSRLKQYRSDHDLTLDALEKIIHVPAQTINRYELEQRVPKIDAAVEIALSLSINPLWLQGFDVPILLGRCANESRMKNDVSQEAQKIAKAFDKATPKEQNMVRLTLSEYLDDEQEFQYAAARGNSRVKIPVQDDDDLPENDTIIDGL